MKWFLGKAEKLEAYRWSSYGQYLKSPGRRVKWMRVDRLLGEMGIPRDSAAGRKELARRMELRRWEDQPQEWRRVRRGWCLGNEAFRKELLAQMAERAGASHYGEELRESAQEKAQRMMAEELKRLVLLTPPGAASGSAWCCCFRSVSARRSAWRLNVSVANTATRRLASVLRPRA